MSFILLGILNSQISATGGTPAYELIESRILTTAASTITFSSIPANYKHLQIRGILRSNRSDTWSAYGLRVNNDSGNNYARHTLFGDRSSVSSGSSTSTSAALDNGLPAANATANYFVPFVADFLDYSNTSKNKTMRFLYQYELNGASIYLSSALWQNTNAINQISVYDQIGSFVAGSRISLYGIK
jgi:hypothetical protein